MLKEDPGKLEGVVIDVAGDEDSLFCEAAHYNKDGIKTFRVGEFDNVVHGNQQPRVAANREGFEETIRAVLRNLGLEAGFASPDVLGDIPFQS